MNTLALLPNLAGPDMIIIFVIVLIMFGAKKLPEFAKGLGQAVREFSKAKENVNQELHNASQVVEHAVYHPAIETPALPQTVPAQPVNLVKSADNTAAGVLAPHSPAVPAVPSSPVQPGLPQAEAPKPLA